MSTEEMSKPKTKIIIVTKCLKMLARPLRDIVSSYLQYEERLKMKGFLGCSIPELPALTVEEMVRNKVYSCLKQPLSESIYIPYIERWILTGEMVCQIMKSGLIRNVFWECPECRTYHQLIRHFRKGPRINIIKVDFVEDSSSYCACMQNAEYVRDRNIEIAFEDGQKIPKVIITEEKHELKSIMVSGALNNTYPVSDLMERFNSDGWEHKQSLYMMDIFDDEYITKWKTKVKNS
jgi:hypothetical protein